MFSRLLKGCAALTGQRMITYEFIISSAGAQKAHDPVRSARRAQLRRITEPILRERPSDVSGGGGHFRCVGWDVTWPSRAESNGLFFGPG